MRLVLQLCLLAHLQDGAQLLADVLERRDVVLGPGPHADARPLLPPRQHRTADLRLGPRRPDLWLGMDRVAVLIKQKEYNSKESTEHKNWLDEAPISGMLWCWRQTQSPENWPFGTRHWFTFISNP